MSLIRTTSLSLVICTTAAFAQQQEAAPTTQEFTNSLGQTVTVTTPTSFLISPPVKDWPHVEERESRAEERREVDERPERPPVVNPAALDEVDPVVQTTPASRMMHAPSVNFPGSNGTGYPPDPTGAAGTDYYVQAVNTSYKVWHKTGVSASATYNLSTLWTGSTNDGDPIVLYDRHADRWFISQFNDNPNRMLIAVSQTNDPLGSYYAYSFSFSQFPDYPKFSVWWDGYYMTSNSTKTAVVFERTAMLAGDPNARMVALSAPGVVSSGFKCVMPADADGDLPPDGTPCWFFNLEDNAWGAPADRIKIYRMNTDWTNVANTTVVQHQTLNTAAFDTNIGTGWENIAQPNTTQKLDAGMGYMYFRAQHTRWVDHNSVMLCHGTDVGGDHCGVRWYELRDANDGNWTIYQQGTWAPDAADRFQASIGMNDLGDIGLAYNVADELNSIYCGIRYTGRLAGDPLGQMTLSETNAIAGTGAQTGTERFGDYGHLSLDPDGNNFWFTGEYFVSGGNIRTRIFSFNVEDEFLGVEEGTTHGQTFTAFLAGGILNINAQDLPSTDGLVLDVIAMDGKQVITERVNAQGSSWNGTLDVDKLAPGIYFARIGNARFQRVQRFNVAQ
ncbi:MAG: T9SS type A sorting domain-containing protein [Flavobacteriales bacterium]|nr:T9SS type A sorting domain-containing protein [Flavobacteriales bacterium]